MKVQFGGGAREGLAVFAVLLAATLAPLAAADFLPRLLPAIVRPHGLWPGLTLTTGAIIVFVVLGGSEALAAYWAAARLRVGWGEIIGRRAPRGAAVGVLAGLGLVALRYWSGLPVSGPRQAFAGSPWGAVYSWFFAPSFESVFFCGIAYSALKRSRGRAGATVIATALFVLAHIPTALAYSRHAGITRLVPTLAYISGYNEGILIGGLVFTITYEMTGSLAAPLVAHIIANLGG